MTTDQHEGSKSSYGRGQAAGTGVSSLRKLLIIIISVIVALVIVIIVAAVVLLLLHFNKGQESTGQHSTFNIQLDNIQHLSSIRLDNKVKPIHYSITLAPFLYGNNPDHFYFTGSVNIYVKVLRNTRNFQLHAVDLKVPSVRILGDRGSKSVSVKSVHKDKMKQWLSITTEELQAGKNYTIVIDKYTGPLKNDLIGLYLSSYNESGANKYLVASQMEATHARKAIPCFDEPAMKATFGISLVRRQDFTSISNMPLKSSVIVSRDDWFKNGTFDAGVFFKDDFQITPKMSTYLLAFVVSQFQRITSWDSKNRKYVNWARSDVIWDTFDGLKSASDSLNYFESYLNVPYPLRLTNQAAVPDFISGAMENWGLFIYREYVLSFSHLLEICRTTKHVITVAHEVAHQWFGNLVTMAWWDDIWLNEAFATYLGHLGAMHMHPDWFLDAAFVVEVQAEIMKKDSTSNSHPVFREASSPKEIINMFEGITYFKGGSIVRMMHRALGDGVFKTGLTSFLRKNSYSNAVHTDLYNSLTQQARLNGMNIDVGEIMDTWIKQMGYPLVNCTRRGIDELLLTQRHFLADAKNQSSFNYTWIIPVTMVTKDNISSWDNDMIDNGLEYHPVQWMSRSSQSFPIHLRSPSSWYLVNLRSAGYYRVNYDESNWKALVKQLLYQHKVFTSHERARMLDDSLALARAGFISSNIPVEMFGYLKREYHYVPWRLVQTHVLLKATNEIPLLNATISHAVHQIYAKSHSILEQQPKGKRRFQSSIVRLACYFNVPQCISDAEQMCIRQMNTSFLDNIAADVRKSILCRCTNYNRTASVYRQRIESILMSDERNSLLEPLRKELEVLSRQPTPGDNEMSYKKCLASFYF